MDKEERYYRDGKYNVCKALQEWANELRDQVNKLNMLLAADQRIDDIVRSASDPEYQLQLLKEYHLL